MIENIWLASAMWIGLALVSALISIRLALSVALIEIMVGAIAGNVIDLPLTPWINYLAGFGAILLTFLAGAEVDMEVVRRNVGVSVGIGFISFLLPYLGCMLVARYLLGWDWPQPQIAGISLSTTSVAVVYAVMVETGLNKTELGKIILAACFITDLGTVLALGIVFASFTVWLLAFVAATVVVAWFMPKIAPWFFAKFGRRVSEPEIKSLLLVLFSLGGFATAVGSGPPDFNEIAFNRNSPIRASKVHALILVVSSRSFFRKLRLSEMVLIDRLAFCQGRHDCDPRRVQQATR
jgi:Kef-type K+ transport system membrane component KefB